MSDNRVAMSAVLEKPTWALVGVFPLTNDQLALDRLKVVLDESDEAYFKELTQYYRSIRQPEFTPEKHREAMIYLEQHPLRNMLLQRLVFWTSRNQSSLRMIIDKNKTIPWPEMVWPNAATTVVVPSGAEIYQSISKLLEDGTLSGTCSTAPSHSPERLPKPSLKSWDACACGVYWETILLGNECAKCGEKRPTSTKAQLIGPTELSEKKRHTLLTKTINEINSFYYKQIDNGRFSGETVFMITCEQTSATSELVMLGERVSKYFNNIFDPEYPRKKFHISTVANNLTDGSLCVVFKWGLHAERANHPEKYAPHIDFIHTDFLYKTLL